ncbi:MAG: isopentenyl phosphate kinase [Candidatus Hydrothermarchaeaceae archaeon]
MIILKLGGSLITDKSKRFVIRKEAVERVAKEIEESGVLQSGLVIVHGGGSFGHPVAKEYGLDGGLIGPAQIQGVAATRSAMTKLNTYLVEVLVGRSIPAVSVQTSAVVFCKAGRIERFDFRFIKKLLTSGLVPILYGDVVVDSELRFSILSGDQIVSYLSRSLNPDRIILATDVDGVFDMDPKEARGSKARLIPVLTYQEFASIDFGERNDATGGIKGKLVELLTLAQDGHEAYIINALRRDRLKKALSGIEVKGTRVGVLK